MYTLEYYAELLDPWTDELFFVKLEHGSFRCDCLCNLFRKHKTEKLRYKCNACEATYTGEI